MTDSDFTDEELEAQAGEHNIDTSPSLSDDEDGFLEFEFESKAVFELFAKDIYKNDEAGIREPLANALTAIKRAEAQFDVQNCGVEITLKDKGPDGQKIIIQDNGIGISEQVLKNALLVIGRSLNRDYGKVSGKYGIGFLACYKTVGPSGGFEMYSRSRKTDEYIAGIWKPGGFDRDVNNELPEPLDEDQYGTRLEFFIREDITTSQVRNWVERNAKWARYPVMYQEEDTKGNTIFEEDYGNHSFVDDYKTETEYLKIEQEHFTAVCSPYAKGRTLLLDSPIERNFNGLTRNPWNIDIRIKNENGVIIKGEYAGLSPVSKNEYNNMSEARQKRYVPKTKLSGDELKLPEPVGTRETLTENDTFWYWLGEQFEKQYREFVENRIESIETIDDVLAAESGDVRLLLKAFDEFNISELGWRPLKKSLEKTFDVSISNSQAKLFITLKEPVEVQQRDQESDEQFLSKEAYRIVLENQAAGGTVYMGVSLNDTKNKIIWEDDENNTVVTVEDSEEYERYERYLSWKKQKQITTKTIEEFDVSSELKDQLFQRTQFDESNSNSSSTKKKSSSESNIPIEERVLRIHTSTGREADHKLTVDQLATELENNTTPFEKLVVFTPNSDFSLTNKKWLATDNIGLANCTVGMFDALSDFDKVITIETHYKKAQEAEVETANEQIQIKKLLKQRNKNIYFHPLPESIWTNVSSQITSRELKKYLLNKVSDIVWTNPEKIIYIPVREKRLMDELRPIFDVNSESVEDNLYIITRDENESLYDGLTTHIQLENPLHAYAYSRLPEWQNEQILDILSSLQISLTNGGFELIETLRGLHDEGVQPTSINLDELQTVENISLETSNGIQTVEEIAKHEFPLFHVLPRESVEMFRTQIIYEYAQQFVKEILLEDYDSVQEADEILYIPLTPVEYTEITPALPENIHLLRGEINDSVKNQLQGVSHNLYSDSQLYAYARLNNLQDTDIFKQLTETRVKFTDGGYNIIETIAKSL